MRIQTTSILVDDNGNEVETGTTLAMTIGKRSVIATFDSITSKGTVGFINPITSEKFNVRLSSITSSERCSFKLSDQ